MHRPDWDTYFMLQAEIAKLRSNCLTRHIGAVIVKDNRQIELAIMVLLLVSKTVLKEDVRDVCLE